MSIYLSFLHSFSALVRPVSGAMLEWPCRKWQLPLLCVCGVSFFFVQSCSTLIWSDLQMYYLSKNPQVHYKILCLLLNTHESNNHICQEKKSASALALSLDHIVSRIADLQSQEIPLNCLSVLPLSGALRNFLDSTFILL